MLVYDIYIQIRHMDRPLLHQMNIATQNKGWYHNSFMKWTKK